MAALAAAAVLSWPPIVRAQDDRAVRMAPEWRIDNWINSRPLKLADLRGKVVILEFFQLWCPGSNHFSVPLMLKWEKMFRDNPDVVLLSIHSVFEGHDQQTPEELLQFMTEKKIRHPVGIDRHEPGNPIPLTMQAYDIQGTPEIIIIDKAGQIRFQKFGSFDWFAAERLIQNLARE